MTKRTPKADVLRDLTLQLLELESAMQEKAVQLTRPHGQTPARWKVLSAASENQLTVPQIARRMGLSRQAVQTIANALVEEELARYLKNPDHKSSPFLQPTKKGLILNQNITDKYIEWSNQFVKPFSKTELLQCTDILGKLLTHLNETMDTRGRGKR